jgi:hypothetical protein
MTVDRHIGSHIQEALNEWNIQDVFNEWNIQDALKPNLKISIKDVKKTAISFRTPWHTTLSCLHPVQPT